LFILIYISKMMKHKIGVAVSSTIVLGIWTNFFFYLSKIDTKNENIADSNETDRYIRDFGGYVR